MNNPEDIRTNCLDMAVKSGCGQYFNDEGKLLICDTQIVAAAKKFEEFIKGMVDIPATKKEG